MPVYSSTLLHIVQLLYSHVNKYFVLLYIADRPAIPVAAADNHSDSMALQPMSHTGSYAVYHHYNNKACQK